MSYYLAHYQPKGTTFGSHDRRKKEKKESAAARRNRQENYERSHYGTQRQPNPNQTSTSNPKKEEKLGHKWNREQKIREKRKKVEASQKNAITTARGSIRTYGGNSLGIGTTGETPMQAAERYRKTTQAESVKAQQAIIKESKKKSAFNNYISDKKYNDDKMTGRNSFYKSISKGIQDRKKMDMQEKKHVQSLPKKESLLDILKRGWDKIVKIFTE